MTAVATRLRVVDDALPGAQSLVSDDLPAPIAAAYAAVGSSARRADPIHVTWWPRSSLTVRYKVHASSGPLAGERDVVATVGKVPDGAFIAQNGDSRVGVWIVPNDPALPGLRSALDPDSVTAMLSQVGIKDGVANIRLRAYRPTRRAVIEVDAGRARLYLKVVRPSAVAGLHERHRLLSGHVPVPDSLGLSPDLGILAMPFVPGTDLRTLLRAGRPTPEISRLATLVHDLPEPAPAMTARSALENLPPVIDLLKRLVPEDADLVRSLGREIGKEPVSADTPVHGDFHEAQVMVAGDRLGLLDVDTFGWGRPGDDPANMLAHLDLLAASTPTPSQVLEMARSLNRLWDRTVDPVDLRLRTAAVVLGLAVGPFRVQRPDWPREVSARVKAAERWVESAHRVDERSLITTSGNSHGRVRR